MTGKKEIVKVHVNINILGISELKWTGMGKFNSDGQESLGRIRVEVLVNKRVQNAVLECNLKKDRMISVHFQDKPLNITVIQSKSMPQPARLKKLKLKGSVKIYKTF